MSCPFKSQFSMWALLVLDKTELTSALTSFHYLRYPSHSHSDPLPRSQMLCMRNVTPYCTELAIFFNEKGTLKCVYHFLSINKLHLPSSESATLFPLEQAVTMIAKGAHVNENTRDTRQRQLLCCSSAHKHVSTSEYEGITCLTMISTACTPSYFPVPINTVKT